MMIKPSKNTSVYYLVLSVWPVGKLIISSYSHYFLSN